MIFKRKNKKESQEEWYNRNIEHIVSSIENSIEQFGKGESKEFYTSLDEIKIVKYLVNTSFKTKSITEEKRIGYIKRLNTARRKLKATLAVESL